MEGDFDIVLSLVMAVLGAIFVWRAVGSRHDARRRGPVRARVMHVMREERRTRIGSWLVTTGYEVPGHGTLEHRRWFEDEGPAILWQRLHREGSEHDVFPNRREPGTVFVREDLE